MNQGRVYLWDLDPANLLGGRLRASIVPLERLDADGHATGRLSGHYVRVRNAGCINMPLIEGGKLHPVAVAVGDAAPDANGDFLFEPGRGGGRIDKVPVAEPDFRERYVQAAHFGEVNSYYHVDRIAAYIGDLLKQLQAPPLPRVTVVVNAHHAATEVAGIRDGLHRDGRWLPFQGGHYRLPSRKHDISEYEPLAPEGEIHLGPGRCLLDFGALVEVAGGRYRANASHNAGILYHEYGHHVTRHTADFRANRLRRPGRQDNRKTALDEGTCDYLTAALLGVPHIWALHRRHDAHGIHPRSLASSKTMADFDVGRRADPHSNGTIWASALWELRIRLAAHARDGAQRADLIVLKSLLLLGDLVAPSEVPCRKVTRRIRSTFSNALVSLLRADEILFAGRHSQTIIAVFAARGIHASSDGLTDASSHSLCRQGR